MAEIEKPEGKLQEISVSPVEEIIEKAGKRTFAENLALARSVEAVLNREQIVGEGRIRNAETISDIDTRKGKTEVAHFSEGAVGFHRVASGKLICASDTHGDFAALAAALGEFLKRKESGEEVYFNFSGDFYTLDSAEDGLPQIEALMAAKAKYPQAVFWETGNADRAHVSFFTGMGTDILKKYAGEETYKQIQKVAGEALDDFCQTQYGATFIEIEKELSEEGLSAEERKIREEKYPKLASVKKFGKIFFENAVFLNEARASGAELFGASDFPAKFIYQKLNDILIVPGKDDKSREREKMSRLILMRHLGRSLVGATQPYKTERKTDTDPEKVKQAFELYEKIAGVINRLPILNIVNIPKENKNIVLSHSWPVGMKSISQIVYDPIRQREAAWNKFFEDAEGTEERKKGEFAYGPDALKEWFLKNNVVLGQFGHNHANQINELGEGMFRLEVATTLRAKKEKGVLREPAYAIVDISDVGELQSGNWGKTVKFEVAKI